MAEEFTCPVDEIYRSACKDLPKYSGSRYCVLHEPDKAKDTKEFEKVRENKLARRDYDFGGTIFPEGASDFKGTEFDTAANFGGASFFGDVYFQEAQFSGETNFQEARFSGQETYFNGAQFNGPRTNFVRAQFSGEETYFAGAQFSGYTHFKEAQFSGQETYFHFAQFSGPRTSFVGAQFSGARTYFDGAQFSGATTFFNRARFSGARTFFAGAQFSGETYFREATFVNEVTFSGATFREKVDFRGSKANPIFLSGAWARFDSSRIEKPEQLKFNTVLLHPGWFINADVRKVNFTDVKWYGMPGGPKGTLDEEIGALKQQGDIEAPHTLLAQTCRRLSANAEENREYPLANEFHYWSMDSLRKEGSGRLGLIGTLYWALSGYGVRAAQAFWMLVGIWAVFTTLYVLVNPSEFGVFRQGICYFWQAGVYSLLAIARLNPEPRPDEPGLFQLLVGLEGIFGPLQIALLALAIRRQVMR